MAKEDLTAEVAKAAYAGLTNAETAAAINAQTTAGGMVDVTVAEVVSELALDGTILKLEAFAASPPAGSDAIAVAAAKLLAQMAVNQSPITVFRMSNPTTAAKIEIMLAALVADPNTGITAEHQAAILALATPEPTIPLWQALGFTAPLDHGDIIIAKGEKWEDHALPNYNLISLVWAKETVTGITKDALPFKPGAQIALTVSACIPDEFEGDIQATIVDANTFTYPLKDEPLFNPFFPEGDPNRFSALQVGAVAETRT